jgi:two-component system OmpR family response regulator
MIQPILIIEDDSKIARIEKVYLEGAGYKVVYADTGKAAIDAAMKQMPALAILDLNLPDISGEEVCQELRQIGDFPIIMVTAKSSEEERVAGFALGADDYIVKPFSPRELVARIKAVLRRQQKGETNAGEPLSFNKGALVIDGQSYDVKIDDRQINITPTEFRVLYVLASNPGRVFPREELVEKALGYQFEGYERSIDAHIKNIRHKLEKDPRSPDYILTIYGVGYRFSGKRDV